jgi:hypothetical protein
MNASPRNVLSATLISELEKKYFWWEPVGEEPRTEERILAQAMDLADFKDIRRLETVIGPARLADVMKHAQPGWISERSWDLWRGRLSLATRHTILEGPPRRSLHVAAL